MAVDKSVPLCVDLDGTLIKSDSLHESALEMLKEQPRKGFESLLTIKQGKAEFKSRVSELSTLDCATIPCNSELLQFLAEEKRAGRKLILVTGASEKIARQFFAHFKIFDDVFSSTDTLSLTGDAKRDCLVDTFGIGKFDYVGNDKVDNTVWDSAREIYVVSRDNKFLRETADRFDVKQTFVSPNPDFRDWARLIRVHQWAKNLLLFVPLGLDHSVSILQNFQVLLGCFFAFSFLASLTYIVNDLLDLRSDRLNLTKSKRPLARGIITIKEGLQVILLLMVAVGVLLLFLPSEFTLVLSIYLILTLGYTVCWKRYVYLDVCVLAGLHSLRIIAGTVALQLEWSFWLLCFSLFIFMSLALAKRVAELTNLKKLKRFETIGRGYVVGDIPILTASGLSSAHLSVLVVALYINSDKVLRMYKTPEVLWLICPLLLYWTGRIWLITSRGEMHEDPIVFALRDGTSQITFILCVAVILIAMYWSGLYA